MGLVLATCVPYFPDGAQIGRSSLLLLVAKPLTYLLFVLCFRYRVSTPAPLQYRRMFAIVTVATIAGFILICAGAAIRWSFQSGHLESRDVVHWSVLVLIRGAIWAGVGSLMVQLRGRRLAGWVLSGIGIDLAFDLSVSAVYDGSWIESGVVGLGLLAFLAPLYVIGRRTSLRSRFLSDQVCHTCAYDLMGIDAMICPECGTPVEANIRRAIAARKL